MSAPTDRTVSTGVPRIPVQRPPLPEGGGEPHLRRAEEVLAELGTDPGAGLGYHEAARRLQQSGRNELVGTSPPRAWLVALTSVADPVTVLLAGVVVAAALVDQVATAVLVGALALLAVVLRSRRELRARPRVDALATLQVPPARVRREGRVELVPAGEVVPGDLVLVEAGDVVPADGRLLSASWLEAQEAALTGDRAPAGKGTAPLTDPDVALADRTNMLFQYTSVTRGSGVLVVTATGMRTQMGRIATMLTAARRPRSPLRRELDRLDRGLAVLAWAAVALVVVVGVARGLRASDVLLLGAAMAVAAIPTTLPVVVQAVLSSGARRLAGAGAAVVDPTDVDTLAATGAITTGTSGTLTPDRMAVSSLFVDGAWLTVDGTGVRGVAATAVPDVTRLALALVLGTEATARNGGAVAGDPAEAALVGLAAELGVDAEATRRAYPRLAEVALEADRTFLATFHRLELDGVAQVVGLVRGAPDVVLARCSRPGAEAQRTQLDGAARRMGEQGLRVLAVAARVVSEADLPLMRVSPLTLTDDLGFVGLVGLVDPPRPTARDAVETARGAGIDVRVVTGDPIAIAGATGARLGLGDGAISGAELHTLSDDELRRRLPRLHVLGRGSPEDELRLVRTLQDQGVVVAVTGDAAKDAAALAQADVGLATGGGSLVAEQSARVVLPDDDLGTVVDAVRLARGVRGAVVAALRGVLTQLVALVLLLVTATVFDIDRGLALTPLMVVFLTVLVAPFPVVLAVHEPGDPAVLRRRPRDLAVPIPTGPAVSRWIGYGAVLFLMALVPLLAGPDALRADGSSRSMTMAYLVVGLGTICGGIVLRRDPAPGLAPPVLRAVAWSAVPLGLLILSTQLDFLQRGLGTQGLTALQWAACAGLAAVLPVVVEIDKAVRRRQRPMAPPSVPEAVGPRGSADPAG